MFSLESPHRGDSNEYTQYTIFNTKKKNTLNYPKSAAMGFCSKGPKKEFEITMAQMAPFSFPYYFTIPNYEFNFYFRGYFKLKNKRQHDLN